MLYSKSKQIVRDYGWFELLKQIIVSKFHYVVYLNDMSHQSLSLPSEDMKIVVIVDNDHNYNGVPEIPRKNLGEWIWYCVIRNGQVIHQTSVSFKRHGIYKSFLKKEKDKVLCLSGLWTDPVYRNQGLAQATSARICKDWGKRGYNKTYTITLDGNVVAKALREKIGEKPSQRVHVRVLYFLNFYR